MTATGRSDEKSDGDLLAAHAGGDPQAFSELVRRHRDRMWAVALRTLRDPDEAAAVSYTHLTLPTIYSV